MYRRIFRLSICILIPFALAGGILCGTLPNVATAQDTWTNPAGGFFDVGTNWADGSAPGAGESALFDLAATYDINWDSLTGNTTNVDLTVDDGDLTFFSTGGTFTHSLTGDARLNGGHFRLGRASGEAFNLDIGGSLRLDPFASMTVRYGSQLSLNDQINLNGTLNILDGGVVTNSGPQLTIVGSSSVVSAPAAVVNVGSGGQWNPGGLRIGLASQDAEVNVSGGGIVNTAFTTVGSVFPSGQGEINLSGAGTQWTTGSFEIGSLTGRGEIEVTSGASASSFSTSIGGGTNGGSVLVSGVGSLFETTGLLEVGVPMTGTGDGSIRIENGGVVTSGSAFLTEATVVITGAGSRWTNTGRLDFGNAVENDLSQFIRVRNGGTLESDEIFVLKNTWLRAQDAGSSITTTGDVFVGGNDGRGLLTVQNNASMDVGGRLFIGVVGGAGDVQLFGGGATLNANRIEVGSTGFLALLTGSQITTQELRLTGQLSLLQGTIDLTGTDSVLTIDQSNLSTLSPVLELDDSTLNVAGQTVFGSGVEVLVENAANFTSASVINNGSINVTNSAVMGSNARHDGYGGNGTLNVGTASVTLNDAGLADLGRVTNINGGILAASNGISIGSGDTIVGNGQINGRISGGGGSAIYASGGDLTIGDAIHVAGFSSSGELYTLANTLTILDDNQARLGSYTELGDTGGSGYLQIDNGAVINFGDNLVGYGTIDNQDTLATAIINNGTMQGNSAIDRLIVEGYVKGVGTFDNVQFNGTFAPGLSPACIDGNNFFFGPDSNLEMELGGLIRCAEHDAIRATGLLALDGTLDVLLINGFNPELGDSFDLFDWATLDGEFAAFDFPTLDVGLRWNTSELYASGTLSVSAVPEPASFVLLGLAATFVAFRRRRSWTGNSSDRHQRLSGSF